MSLQPDYKANNERQSHRIVERPEEQLEPSFPVGHHRQVMRDLATATRAKASELTRST